MAFRVTATVAALILGLTLGLAVSDGSTGGATARIAGELHGKFGIIENKSILVIDMHVSKLPHGATVEIECTKGCRTAETVRALKSGIARGKKFGHRLQIPRGAVIRLHVTKPGLIGWSDKVTVLAKANAIFRQDFGCLSSKKPFKAIRCDTPPPGCPQGKIQVLSADGKTTCRDPDVVGDPTPTGTTDTNPGPTTSNPTTSNPTTGNPTTSTPTTSTPTTTLAPPGLPSPSVSGESKAGFKLSWDSVARATGYRVYRGGSLVASVAVTSYDFGGLDCGTSYAVSVEAFNTTGPSDRASTSGKTRVCDIGAVAITNPTKTGFTAAWSAVKGATGYRAYLGANPLNPLVTGLSYDFTGLECGTSYGVGIAAVDADGPSTRESTTGKTRVCDVGALNVSNVARTGFTICWAAVKGASSGYRITRNGANAVDEPAGTTCHDFTGLGCNTSHTISVAALDGSDSSPYSIRDASTSSDCRSVGASLSARFVCGQEPGQPPDYCKRIVVSYSGFASGNHTVQCSNGQTYTTSTSPSSVCVVDESTTSVWAKVDGVDSRSS